MEESTCLCVNTMRHLQWKYTYTYANIRVYSTHSYDTCIVIVPKHTKKESKKKKYIICYLEKYWAVQQNYMHLHIWMQACV